jgi:hypothetical protein
MRMAVLVFKLRFETPLSAKPFFDVFMSAEGPPPSSALSAAGKKAAKGRKTKKKPPSVSR